nr:glycosyltransferase [Helleborus thibetanus]
METDPKNLHILFIPLMAPGHMNPLIDMARLFAARGVNCTILTTPINASRFQATIDRDTLSGLRIQTHILQFPCSEAQLPQNCENVDLLPSRDLTPNFAKATTLLHPQTDDLVKTHLPDAIISDLNFPWTVEIAQKYNIPRLVFHGSSCFASAVTASVNYFLSHMNITSETEPFLVPGLPDVIYVTKAQLPIRSMRNMNLGEFFNQVREADRNTLSAVVNSFYGLEPDYITHYEKLTGKKVWTLGPVSLLNKDFASKSIRGNKSAIDEAQCLAWLDSKKPKSVLYVCFGSLCHFAESQIQEIGSGLEDSGYPFIWVIKESDSGGLPDGFMERVEGRGLVIKGWAPQVMILSHGSIGGFMTHCGWNSVLESVSYGLPMISWPLFAEQFYNQRFVLDLVKVGVGIGVERGLDWGEEESIGALVSKERVKEVVTQFMGDEDEVREMRERASRLGEMARSAVEEGGSSYENMGLLIEELLTKKSEKLNSARKVFL